MPEVKIEAGEKGIGIAQMIKTAGLTDSTSEAVRMIQQGAVRIDGERVQDRNLLISSKKTIILQVGKRRFAKVVVN